MNVADYKDPWLDTAMHAEGVDTGNPYLDDELATEGADSAEKNNTTASGSSSSAAPSKESSASVQITSGDAESGNVTYIEE